MVERAVKYSSWLGGEQHNRSLTKQQRLLHLPLTHYNSTSFHPYHRFRAAVNPFSSMKALGAMEENPSSDAAATASFRLLDLPREIRNLIYEKMVVRDKVDVQAIRVREDGRLDQYFGLSLTYPVRLAAKTHHSRSVWSWVWGDYDETLVMSYHLGAMPERFIFPHCTYQLKTTDDASKPGRGRPHLQIFLTNKQIYEEAQLIFYSKNTFAFSEVPACAAFLHDRSPETLRTIRSIEFHVDEKIDPPTDDVQDVKKQPYIYSGGRDMALGELISQRMAFRHLTLFIRTFLVGEFDDDYERWDWANREKVEMSTEWYSWIPAWVPTFPRINKNLDSLEVVWEADAARVVGRSVKAVRAMRSAMVKNSGKFTYPKNEGIRVLMRRRHQGFGHSHRDSDRFMTVHMQADQHGRSTIRQRQNALWDPEGECCHCNRDEELDPCACQKKPAAGQQAGIANQTHGSRSNVTSAVQDTAGDGEGNGEDENNKRRRRPRKRQQQRRP
ncbi:uncharacterized protein BDZ99DRAFT_184750 [Mytilinidion resinicola]|uniref:Uncharacterized protein n=1 Tax=Mytilinidion resinicola TaxID=574789 RepID=A0A6A6Z115_9PEZI|nr:uncharacterized protein BDZ99DRAFT_184750 [Mytilinidion resinicola]KAF2814791.1 hypothetical protein BDZ99DRAFT_184750 [Mytilinidion resinicola]